MHAVLDEPFGYCQKIIGKVIRFLIVLLLFTLSASAAPRDVRRILSDNGFLPDAKIEGLVIGYAEPSMTTVPIGGRGDKLVFLTEFDPLPNVSTKLTDKQARQFAALLADRKTYSPSLGGKACGGFHTDVAIRIPGGTGGLYALLCFTCNQIQLLQHGTSLAIADTDRGRDSLLEFVRSLFPDNEYLKKLPLLSPEEKREDWTKDVPEWARTVIPDDPLLKRVSTLKPEEISMDDLEELDIRATAEFNKP